MEFQVKIFSESVLELEEAVRAVLIKSEWERGRELHRQGILRRLWKVDGHVGNLGLWSAEDRAALQAALESLPIWPYIRVEVTPLMPHPLFAEIESDQARAPQPG